MQVSGKILEREVGKVSEIGVGMAMVVGLVEQRAGQAEYY